MSSLDVKTNRSHNPGVSAEQVADQVAERDRVDERVARWAKEIPGLDLPTEAIAQRVAMLHKHLERSLGETTAPYGLGVGEYKVLTALRGAGPPYRLSPSALASWCSLSSGAMTNRLDNLEEAGLVRRLPDPDDRRALQIELTDKGRSVWQQTAQVQADKEALVTSVLDEAEKEALNGLLRRLVLSFEREFGPLHKGHGTPGT